MIGKLKNKRVERTLEIWTNFKETIPNHKQEPTDKKHVILWWSKYLVRWLFVRHFLALSSIKQDPLSNKQVLYKKNRCRLIQSVHYGRKIT